MSDALSFAEIDGQHIELLPARTVLSSGGPDFGNDPAAAVSGDSQAGPNLLSNLINVAVLGDANQGTAESGDAAAKGGDDLFAPDKH